MERIFAFADGLSTWVARIAALSVIALMLTLTFEVFMRYGLNSPTAWSFDVSYFLNSFFVMMGAAYTLKQNSHVQHPLASTRIGVNELAIRGHESRDRGNSRAATLAGCTARAFHSSASAPIVTGTS